MNEITDTELLLKEIKALHIDAEQNDLENCLLEIKEEYRYLKEEIYNLWNQLNKLSFDILNTQCHDSYGSISNIVFLNSVKKSFLLSLCFDELKEISNSIERIFNLDITSIDELLIEQFNEIYLSIKAKHFKIMCCIYKIQVLKKALSIFLIKKAGITGPWSQLDLPLKERVWNWYSDGDEEWFKDRTEARQNQNRYVHENNFFGVYYSFEDLRRSPYRFGDEDEFIYPSRNQLRIASK